MSTRIWKKERELITALLENYPHYQSYVEARKYELEHPVSEIDDNVGGGKAQFKEDNKVDHMIITLEEDHRLNELRRIHSCIRVCLDDAPEDVHTICKELYFKKQYNREYDSIPALCDAKKVFVAKSKAYDDFNNFLVDCANSLGLPEC